MLLTNATLATMTGPARHGLVEDGAVAVEGERIAWVGPAAEVPGESRRRRGGGPGGSARHAGADRLPHARRLRRRPGGGVRDAARGRELRGGGAGGRRHPLDRARHARGVRGGAGGRRAAAGGRADRRGGHDAGGEVGLRARPGDGAPDAARGPPDRARAPGAGGDELPRRPRGAAGRGRGRLHRRGVHPGAARRARRGAGGRGGRVLRGDRLRRGPDRPGVRRRGRARPAREAARRAAVAHRRRAARGPARGALGRPPGARDGRGRGGDGRCGHRRGAAARRVPDPARHAAAAGRGLPDARGADGRGDRLQPRLLAADLDPLGDEPRLHALPPDAGGGAHGRDAPRRPRAGARRRGAIAPGMRADLAVWDVGHPAELAYRMGFNPLHARYFGGRA